MKSNHMKCKLAIALSTRHIFSKFTPLWQFKRPLPTSACIRQTHCRDGDLWTPDKAKGWNHQYVAATGTAFQPIRIEMAACLPFESAHRQSAPCLSLLAQCFLAGPCVSWRKHWLAERQGCWISDELRGTAAHLSGGDRSWVTLSKVGKDKDSPELEPRVEKFTTTDGWDVTGKGRRRPLGQAN